MAGDHKCPVCQSTFTRPQHVARHMRSHTGDRPYKCQHCGDAFARSDLLSRHVNKCHSAEKAAAIAAAEAAGIPLKSKKGRGAKTACDQCTIEKSVCNLGEPCAKCLTKNIKCTYNQIPTNISTASNSRSRPVPSANPLDYGNFPINPYLPPEPSVGGIVNTTRDTRLDLMKRGGVPSSSGSGITDDSILYGGYRNPYMRSDTDLPIRYHPDLIHHFNNLPTLPPTHQSAFPGVGTLPPLYPPPGTPSTNTSTLANPDVRPGTSGEGFSSAFGLMSLDDPNVLAGLTEHQPFFESEGQAIYDADHFRPHYSNYLSSGEPADISSWTSKRPLRRASLPAIKTPPEFIDHHGPPNAYPLSSYNSYNRDPGAHPPAQPVHPGYAQSQMKPEDLKSYEQAVLERGGEKFRLDSSFLPRRSRTLGGNTQNHHQGYQHPYHPPTVQLPESSGPGMPPLNERPILPPGRNAPFVGPPGSSGASTFPSELGPGGGHETSGSSSASPAMRVGSAQSHHSRHSPASVPIRGMRGDTSSVNPTATSSHVSSHTGAAVMSVPLGPQMPKRPAPKRNASQTLEQDVQKSLKSSSSAGTGELAPSPGYTTDFDFLYNPGVLHRPIPPSSLPMDPLANLNFTAGDQIRPRRGSNVTNCDSAESGNSHSTSASVSASASGISRPSTAESHDSHYRMQVSLSANGSCVPMSSVTASSGAATMPMSVPSSSNVRNSTSSTAPTLTGPAHHGIISTAPVPLTFSAGTR